MTENIKRLLERLWLDWEPITLRGELLNGGDQQLTLTIRRKTCAETAQNARSDELGG